MADFDPYMELPQPQNGFSEEELKHLIALLRIEGVGPVMAKNLIAHCQSAQAVFQQPKGWLERVPQAGDKLAEALRSGAPLQAAEQELERARANDLQILTYIDERYPEPLKTIFDAPLILFKQGTLDFSAQPNVAIVGTRKPTAYGKRLAAEFAGALAELGVNITSGLAYGIDYTAHTTALERGGLTTAVLGHGLHYIYPAQHKKLAHQMRDQGGALLTEYFWGQNAKAKHFPQRNRILSGLSEGIIDRGGRTRRRLNHGAAGL
jgi:DNA processing protein